MSPEYLMELADIADPEQLWRLSGIKQLDLPFNKRKQLDAGVALRRYANHVQILRKLLDEGRSLLITPLSKSGNAVKFIETPPYHQKLRRHEID